MPGEWLMCVWHAAGARDKSGRATPAAIRNITESFSQFATFDFSGDHYKSLFRGDAVDFDDYKRYVTDELKTAGAKATVTARQIEDSCWKTYDTATEERYMRLTHDDTRKLWYVFNRLQLSARIPFLRQIRMPTGYVTTSLSTWTPSTAKSWPTAG